MTERSTIIKTKDAHRLLMCGAKIGIFPLIRTEALKEVGGFDENLRAYEDPEMCMRITEHYNITYIDEPLIILHHEDKSLGSNRPAVIQGIIEVMNKYSKYYSEDKFARWGMLLELASFYGRGKYYKHFFFTWAKAVSLRPFSLKRNLSILIRGLLPDNLTFIVLSKYPWAASLFMLIKSYTYREEKICN